MFNRLDAMQEKYEEVTKRLADPEVLNNFNLVKK